MTEDDFIVGVLKNCRLEMKKSCIILKPTISNLANDTRISHNSVTIVDAEIFVPVGLGAYLVEPILEQWQETIITKCLVNENRKIVSVKSSKTVRQLELASQL